MLLPPGVFDAPFLPSRELSYEELRSLWLRAGAAYGIPWQVLAAINKIESNFGRNMGPSSAGAVGWMQFMPDTWLRWGIDGDGDGIADPWDPDDAVYAAARYLAAAEGRTDIARAIFAYNHAQWYVDDVLELAAMFGGGGGADVVFALDRMAIALEEAEERSHRSARSSPPPWRPSASSPPRRASRRPRSDLELLLSDRLVSQQDASGDAEREAATAEVERLRDGSASLRRRSRRPAAAPNPPPSCPPRQRCSACRPSRRLRLPGRRRPGRRLGRARPPRLSRRGHRRAAGLAGLRARRRDRARASPTTAAAGSGSRPLARRPRVGLLPSLLPRRGVQPGLPAAPASGSGSSARRALDRAAPPPRPQAGALPAGDALVPGVRRTRVHVAGREPPRRRCRARFSRSCRRDDDPVGRGSRIHAYGVLSSVPALPNTTRMTAGIFARVPTIAAFAVVRCWRRRR